MTEYEKWDKHSIGKLLYGIYQDEYEFCMDITKGMTDKEKEEYLKEFPEYRKYFVNI